MSNLDRYIEELKRQIEEFGDLTEDEIVRFIYLSLGKKIVFDTNFLFGSMAERERIYNVGEENKSNYYEDYYDSCNAEKLKIIDEMIDDDIWELICNYTAPLFAYIGTKLGLKIRTVKETSLANSFPHARNLVILLKIDFIQMTI